MRISALLVLVAGWVAASGAGSGPCEAAAEGRKPNVVVLIGDDMGFADVGFHGCKDIPTPNLDALARSGVQCRNGYVSGPYCSPTRAGFLTGRYQERFGHEFNPGGEAGVGKFGLPVSETSLVERFRSAGYATGLVGKWHLGSAPEFHPQKRGFDEFFGFLGGAHTYFAAETKNILRGADSVREETYLTDAFAREATQFIDRNKERPFFLEVTFNAVHTPMDATKERLAKFSGIQDRRRRTYAAMMSAMDDAVGAVVAKLRSAGLENNTLIFFFSDNGGPTMPGTTQNGSINAPFKGSKRTTLEGGIHVPFVASWKGKIPPGRVEDRPVIQLDVLPTALVAAGIPLDPAWNLDGVDILPVLTGEDRDRVPHDRLFWRFGVQDAIRQGPWKLVGYDDSVDTGETSRPMRVKPTPRRLYNLVDDPGETRDLAAEHPEKVAELRSAWQAWDKELVRPLWGPDGAAPASN